MIGDWVVYDGDVENIAPIQVEGMDIATGSLITSDREDVGFDGVQPIPLTPEILEKNGFTQDYEAISVRNDFDKVYFDIPFRFFKYVHELQHALRLVGINKEIEL